MTKRGKGGPRPPDGSGQEGPQTPPEPPKSGPSVRRLDGDQIIRTFFGALERQVAPPRRPRSGPGRSPSGGKRA